MKNNSHPGPATPLFDARPAAGERWRQHLKRAMQALAAGASAVPFGDNGDVFRALTDARRSAGHECAEPCHQR